MKHATATSKALDKPRVGFAGVGLIGRDRLESVASLGQIAVAAVADPVAAHREAALAIAPDATATESFEALLALDLDAVVIATPSGQHAQQAITALNAGLSVFCQKPLGRDVHEVEAVIGAARHANRLVSTDLPYRHTAAFEAVRALVTEGALGRIYAARLVFHTGYGPDKAWASDPRLSGGGCLIDLGIHLVDLALWLMPGAGVSEVQARAFARGVPLPKAEGVEDFVAAQLTMDNDASVELACSWRMHAGREAVIEADLFGTEGGASVRNVNGSLGDFTAYRHQGTRTQVLCEGPDAWGGRAIGGWAQRVAQGDRFDPECRSLVVLAAVLDALYARCRR